MNTTHYTDYETRKALRDRITSLLKRKRYSFKNENEQECVDNDTPACEIRPPAGTPIEKVRKDIQAACKQCGTMADKYASREEGGLQRT